MQDNSKSRVFIRIAAAILLLVLIMNALLTTVLLVSREAEYSTFYSKFRMLSNSFSKVVFWRLIYELLYVIGAVVDAVLSLIAVIMLFALKEKTAGKLFIATVIADVAVYLAEAAVYIAALAANRAEIQAYIRQTVPGFIVFAVIQTLIFLLGLLLTGAFKGGSKVAGFVLLGLFSAGILYEFIMLLRGMPYTLNFLNDSVMIRNLISYKAVSAISSYFAEPSITMTMFAGFIFCCLGVGLTSNNKKIEEAPDAGQQA